MLGAHLQPGNISGYSTSAFSEVPEYCKIRTGNKLVINEEGIQAWKTAILKRTDSDLNDLYQESTSIQRLYPSSLEERIVGPWKKIALVFDNVSYDTDLDYLLYEIPTFDYHWYIQHEDSKWSHKRGLTDAYVVDNSGNNIYDPQICNRDYGQYNYSYFVGYYKIRTDTVYYDGFRNQGSDYYKWDNAGDIASMSRSFNTISATSVYDERGSIEFYNNIGAGTSAGDDNAFVNRYSWEGDVDWFEFMVREAGVYVIQTQGITDTYGALYRGSTLLYANDDINYYTDRNFRLQLTLSPNILYRLRVSGSTNKVHGDYYLTIEKL